MLHNAILETIPQNRRAGSTSFRRAWVLLGCIVLVMSGLGCENQQVPEAPLTPVYPVVDVADEIDDQAITTFLEHALHTASGVQAESMAVGTLDGVVTLSGSVDNILAQERAARIAASVKGVRSVVNRIAVRPSERSDSAIQVALIRALDRDSVTEPWEVVVTVDSGVVTLTGTVESWQERDLAAKTAKGVRGVRSLHNELDVDYTTLRSDTDIQEDVENALKWNAHVDDALIEVRVENGAALLRGAVGSAYERALAATTARVDGVRSVDTAALSVSWWARDEMRRHTWAYTQTDADIERAVEDALRHDPRVASSEVRVSAAGGVVTLSGTVDHLKAKRAAAQDAGNTVGVWQVDNLLRVRPAEPLPDQALAEQVREALQIDPYVEQFDVRVSVDEGAVTLNGFVDTPFERWHAEDVAARVRGVVDVTNDLRIPDHLLSSGPFFYDWDPVHYDYGAVSAGKTDTDVLAAIRAELFWSPYVDEDDITVRVDDGVAELTGTVNTWYERNAAAREAFEGGAATVDNNLHVAYEPEGPSPAQ